MFILVCLLVCTLWACGIQKGHGHLTVGSPESQAGSPESQAGSLRCRAGKDGWAEGQGQGDGLGTLSLR